MNQGVLEIEQHPFAARFAFDADRPVAGLLGFFGDVFDQRSDVPIGRAACDDHVVRYRCEISDIEFRDVLRFYVVQCIDDQRTQLFAVHAYLSLFIKLLPPLLVEQAGRLLR